MPMMKYIGYHDPSDRGFALIRIRVCSRVSRPSVSGVRLSCPVGMVGFVRYTLHVRHRTDLVNEIGVRYKRSLLEMVCVTDLG